MMTEQLLTLGLALALLLLVARRRAVPARRPSLSDAALPWSFTFEPLFLVLAAVAVDHYVRAWRRRHGPLWRAWCFGAGVVLVVGALNSPLGTIAIEYLVLFHLLQNVMISDWAPPLLLIGLTPMREAIATRGGRWFASLTRPTVALPVWLVGWYVVHLSAFYDTAVRNPLPARARAPS